MSTLLANRVALGCGQLEMPKTLFTTSCPQLQHPRIMMNSRRADHLFKD